MAIADISPPASFADLQRRLIDYSSRVGELRTPSDVLDELHAVTTRSLPLGVLGAARFPLKSTDWSSIQLGKSAFLHKDVPEGWWEEHNALAQGKFRPILFLARSSMASSTWTEVTRMLEPIGVDRWSTELAFKYGMRDGFTCPVGGRWVVAFWSRRNLSNILTQQIRIMVFAAASFAALAPGAAGRPGCGANRIARAFDAARALRSAPGIDGGQCHDMAQSLGLGEETIRSHLKKAQAKLGVRNRAHAVAEALRQNLIP